MLPDLNCMYLPAEEILNLKKDELIREFEEIRLISAARQSNPGFAERARLWLARLFHTERRLRQPALAPRQSYIDYAIKMAS